MSGFSNAIGLVITATNPLVSTFGGTGVSNAFNITVGGALTTSNAFSTTGAFSMVLNATAPTNVTLPTSGTLVTAAGVVAITDVTTTSATMVDNAPINIYVTDNASLVTLTLPATITFGHSFYIWGKGAGGWKIAQNAGQSVVLESNLGVATTTVGTGGSLNSNLSADCINLGCSVANTTLTITNSYGNISYI